MDDKKRKRGRPKSSGATKNVVVAMRIRGETGDKLDILCEKYGKSRADLLENWVDNQYKMMENGLDLL